MPIDELLLCESPIAISYWKNDTVVELQVREKFREKNELSSTWAV